jgi:enoyl-CoA hydratase
MNLEGFETLLLRQDGHVLTVALNRPELRNATNLQMERELCRVLGEANHDPDIRVLIITGTGEAFCAGGDFAYIRDNVSQPAHAFDGGQRAKEIIFSLLDCVKPIVAKINGHAIGFGATLALFCDITFAAEHAKIGDPHVAIGLVAGDGGSVIWPQLVGYARAKEHLFSGESLLAPEAARIGLINRVLPAAELDQTVEAYAAKLAAMPARALQWTKASVNIGLKQLAHSIMDASIGYELLSTTTADHREAIAALDERRKPKFTGN